jgi:acyl-CoA-binding protein
MATKMTSDLEKKFKRAVWLIRNGPPQEGTSTAQKLKFYSLYKQATEGDVTSPSPGPCR